MRIEPVLLAIPSGNAPRSAARVARQRSYARLALRECAERCGAPLDGWRKDESQVPVPQAGYFWSLSHKRHWAAAVIADRPVGIDIEHVAPRRDTLYDALAGEAEWALFGGRSWPAFYRVWTAKEATLKANGVGITGFSECKVAEVPDERHIKLDFRGRIWTVEHYYQAEHVAAVTCFGSDVNWRVLDRLVSGD